VPGCTHILKKRIVLSFLKLVEVMLPPDRHIVEHIVSIDPALVLAAPVNMKQKKGTPDLEYLKAAKSLAIPTIVPVISWDNLTKDRSMFCPIESLCGTISNMVRLESTIQFQKRF
jgi:hypothetical protein